ncbi:DUF4912 domain-containing protein [Leptolyngbya ohadii]|uniref:DUF4912 domain-containing protein n=1 Tax=Leptolyngbya ohadii TaxID=1962290 RepID=UPI000B59E686
MLQGKTSSVFTLSVLLTLAAPNWLPAAFFHHIALAQSSPTSFPLPESVPRGTTVRVDGSDSMAVINQALKQKFEAQYPGTAVNLATGGTPEALRAVLDGTIDLAAIGRPLTQAEKAQGLVEVPIAREKVAIIVGPENPFRGDITFEQFARIFRGEITDWSQLGGAPGRIRFVDRPENSDTRLALRNYKVFQVAPFQTGNNATQVSQDSTAAVIADLGRDGISYAIASQVLDQPNVRIVTMHGTLPTDPRYPFSQSRGYVYRGSASAGVQNFLGFVAAPVGLATIAQAKAAEAQAVASATGPTQGTAPSPASGTAAPDAIASPSISPVPSPAVSPAETPAATAVPGTASPEATAPTNTAATDREGAGWLAWLLLPLALLLGGFLFWRSRRRSTDTIPPAAPSSAAPVVPPVAPDPAVDASGTTLAQRTGSVVSADRLELMGNPSTARSVVPPETPDVPEAAPPAPPIAEPIAEPAAETMPDEIVTIDPAVVEEIPSAAPDPAIPSASIDPTLLGGAAVAAGTGALFGLSELRDRSEAEPSVAEPSIEEVGEVPLEETAAIEEVYQSGFEEVEIAETVQPAVGLPSNAIAPDLSASEPMPAEFVAFPSTEAVEQFPEEIAVEEELAAERIEELERVEPIASEPIESPIIETATIESSTVAEPAPTDSSGLPLGAIAGLGAIAAAGMAAAQSRAPSDEPSDEVSVNFRGADLETDELPAEIPQPETAAEMDAQSLVESTRFDVGQSDLSSEELATVDANLPDLPGGYGESQIVLLPRDPQWAYAYWDVPAEAKEQARQQGGTRFALRFYDVTNIDFSRQKPHSLQQYECDEMARNWYIPVPLSDRDYIAEIGYVTNDGGWIMLARSLPVRVPPVYPSDWYSEQFVTIGWEADLRDKTFLKLSPPGERKTFDNPIYDRIFGLSESVEAQRVAGSLYGSMQQIPQQAVSSFASGAGLAARTESGVGMSGAGMYMMSGVGMSGIGMSGIGMSGIGMSGVGMMGMSGIGMMSGAGMSGAALYTLSGLGMMSGVGMAGMSGVGVYPSIYTMSGAGMMSGVGMMSMSGIGMMSGVGFSASMPPMRPRRFWLIADAELIVYGATEPDATVTIAGRPVQLNPDGTFRFQMSFQDGMIDFPILAVASDGEQTRSIHMNFTRETPSRNTNPKEEAQDEWFPR